MAIGFLAKHLTEESLGTALAAVQAITDEAERGKESRHSHLICLLTSSPLRCRQRRHSPTRTRASTRSWLSHGICRNQPRDRCRPPWPLQAIEDETRRSRGIEALAPYLPAGQLAAALDVAAKM
jgi:hypothetical protein